MVRRKSEEDMGEAALALNSSASLAELAPELADGVNVVDELAGTWAKEKSPIIIGRLSHAYSWDAADDQGIHKTMYGVALVTRNEVMVNADDGVCPAEPGSMVGVTLADKLLGLLYLRPDDVVGIQFMGKASLKGGRSCGRYRLRSSSGLRETPMTVAQRVRAPF